MDNESEKFLNINDLGSMNSDKIKANEAKKNYFIIGGIMIALIILMIVIIIFMASGSSSDNKKNEKKSSIGTINAIYEINMINTKISILGEEFKKNSDFDIYIDNQKMNQYSKVYIFNKIGIYKINIELYEDINMDYMFKDIQSLVSVGMNSKNNCKIN